MKKKFRAWTGSKLLYSGETPFHDSEGCFPDEIIEVTTKNHGWKWDQWTGLVDKNGVRVYENDILEKINGENLYNNNYQILPIGSEETVEGRPCLCPALPLQQRCVVYDISNELKMFKVVGNIYESKDLGEFYVI